MRWSTFLMIMTRKGNLMPSVYDSLAGQVMYAVVTLVPIIYKTDDWISWSVNRLICPFWTESKPYVTVFIPYLQWFTTDAVQDRQEPWLVSILEHFSETYNNIIIEVKSFSIIHFQHLFYVLLQMTLVSTLSLHLRTTHHQLQPTPPHLIITYRTRRVYLIQHIVILLQPATILLVLQLDLILVL